MPAICSSQNSGMDVLNLPKATAEFLTAAVGCAYDHGHQQQGIQAAAPSSSSPKIKYIDMYMCVCIYIHIYPWKVSMGY
jgi:hypothetical protein